MSTEATSCIGISPNRSDQSGHFSLAQDVFLVPGNHTPHIIYVPLKGTISVVNGKVAKTLQDCVQTPSALGQLSNETLDQLRAAGILTLSYEEIGKTAPSACESGDPCPTSVTLFLTSRCNLKCVYCYADAGNRKVDMPKDIALRAVDFVINNAEMSRKPAISIAFHGGGEPFANVKLMRLVVSYAREQCSDRQIKVHFTAQTNGVLNSTQRAWITHNLSSVCVSLDGPEEIQNALRPKVTGGGSFRQVAESIKFFEDRKFSYSLRATITDVNVGYLREIVDCVAALGKTSRIHFEPVVSTKRSNFNGVTVDPQKFIAKMIDARAYAKSFGIEIYYSGGRSSYVTNKFCGACEGNFYITPDGDVSSCLEVVDSTSYGAEHFVYGKLTNEGFIFFNQRRQNLIARTIDKLPDCLTCFAKYSCAGDCPVKVLHDTGNFYKTKGNSRCEINRALLAEELVSRILCSINDDTEVVYAKV